MLLLENEYLQWTYYALSTYSMQLTYKYHNIIISVLQFGNTIYGKKIIIILPIDEHYSHLRNLCMC